MLDTLSKSPDFMEVDISYYLTESGLWLVFSGLCKAVDHSTDCVNLSCSIGGLHAGKEESCRQRGCK